MPPREMLTFGQIPSYYYSGKRGFSVYLWLASFFVLVIRAKETLKEHATLDWIQVEFVIF